MYTLTYIDIFLIDIATMFIARNKKNPTPCSDLLELFLIDVRLGVLLESPEL